MLAPLTDLVRFYAGPSVDFSLRLVVEPQGAPQAALGRARRDDRPRPGNGPRLGYTAWIGKRRPIQSSLEVRVRTRDAVNAGDAKAA